MSLKIWKYVEKEQDPKVWKNVCVCLNSALFFGIIVLEPKIYFCVETPGCCFRRLAALVHNLAHHCQSTLGLLRSPIWATTLVLESPLHQADIKPLQETGKGRRMIFNKEDIALLASSKAYTFDKEGPIFIQEKSDGFFKRTEGR